MAALADPLTEVHVTAVNEMSLSKICLNFTVMTPKRKRFRIVFDIEKIIFDIDFLLID